MIAVNAGEAKEEGKVFASYALADSGHNLRMLKELKSGEALLPGHYNIKAHLSLKRKKKDFIFESIKYEPSGANGSSNEPLQQGWTLSNKTYYWNPNKGKNTLTIPLSPKPTDKNPFITDSDELHLDYNDLIAKNPSLPSLKMVVSWEESKQKQATVIINGKQLMLLKSVNLPSALWKKKGISYLIKRTFELPHDSSWNFIKKNKYFFYQNRFHLNLNTVHTIDIHFKSNASLKKINSLNCNLRIGFESLVFPTKNMECGWFPKKIFRSNGHIVLRMWTGNLFRSKFGKKEKAFLDEIIFMISKKKLKNIQEQPVASISFHALRQPKISKEDTTKKDSAGLDINNQVFYFQTPITTLSSDKKRLIFPLGDLLDNIGRNAKIENIALSIQPARWDAPAEFILQRLRLVSHGIKEYPAILDVEKKLSTHWGGPFFDQEEISEKLEWIKVQDFFSFTAPNINRIRKPTTFLKDEQEESDLKFNSGLINFRGVQIHAQNGLQSWHADKDGLILEGKGNWVEIDWPVQTKINKKTRFFMNFGDGRENILDLKIKPFTKSRELSPISVSPNKPERLKGISGEIKMLKIKVSLYSSPFRLRLNEVAVFQPILLKPSEILDTPTLVEEETLLVPQNIQTIPEKPVTIFKSHLSAPVWTQEGVPSEVSWTTNVSRRMNRVQGLKVTYKVSPTMHVNNPCWLHFTLVSTNHKINQSLCSEDSIDQIIFPPEKLFNGIKFPRDEILKHVSWKVLAKNQVNIKNPPLPIDIAVSLIGYDIQTFRSDILNHPAMEWNGTALFPNSLDGISKEDIFPHNFLTNLGTVSIKDKSEAHPFFNLLDHPNFQIKSINLRKREPISADDWISLNKKEPEKITTPDTDQDPAFPRLLFFSLLVGGLWWGWRRKEKCSSLKWLIELSPELAQKRIRVWLFIAAGNYLLGFIFSRINWRSSTDIFLTLAGLAILLAWRSFIWKVRPDVEFHLPQWAAKIYSGSGSPYIAGFPLTLVGAAFFLIVGLKSIAEQILVIGYFMLAVGVLIEAYHLRNKNHQQPVKDEGKDASRA